MKDLAETLGALVLLIWWLSGVVLASGLWATVFAACLPPYALYYDYEKNCMVVAVNITELH